MRTKKITALAMLTALGLIIFIVEAQLIPVAPIPGMKLGLANVITLVTLVWYGRKEAFAVLMMRIILGSVFAGTLLSFLYSTAGGILCFLAMSAAWRFLKADKLWVISIFGAIAHNAGQVIIAMVALSASLIAAYFPILAVSAVVTGAFTGLAASFVVKRLKRGDGS